MKLQYTGKQTIFSSEGPVVNEMRSRACFNGGHFYLYREKQIYTILFFKETKENICLPNYSPFNLDEVEKHLHQLDYFAGDDKKIEILEIKNIVEKDIPGVYLKSEEGYNLTQIKVAIEGPNKWHRLFMIWVRYLYEGPFQFAMKDAYRLSEELKIDPFDAVQIVMNGFNDGNTNHTLYGKKQFKIIKKADFKKKFDDLESVVVLNSDSGYRTQKNRSIQDLWISDTNPYISTIENYSIDDWEKTYETRKPIYQKIYERTFA